jgi:hypothetical protein
MKFACWLPQGSHGWWLPFVAVRALQEITALGEEHAGPFCSSRFLKNYIGAPRGSDVLADPRPQQPDDISSFDFWMAGRQ